MADISSMTLPDGSTYNVKDETARSGSGLIEMTKAQYDVLSSAEKNDGKVRFITDDNIDMFKDYRTVAAQDIIDASLQSTVADKADTSYLCYVITGAASPPTSIQEGSYIILRNSTITGITDGLYKATQAIPANTMIDSTYLTAVSGGGLNDLNQKIKSFINLKTMSISNRTIYSGIRLTANVSSGYKFLSWLPTGASTGWVSSFPIYLANPNNITSGVYYNGTVDSGNNSSVLFSFLEILDL